MKKIAVFASGGGTTFKYLYDNLSDEFDFVFVGVDRKCGVEEVAKARGVHVENVKFNMLDVLDAYSPELVVLAGFLAKIPSQVVRKYAGKVINVHPSLLPNYGGKGFYGRKVHLAVKENGDSISGATVHYVNEQYDKGDVIAQRFVNVEGCSVDEIEDKVRYVEKRLLAYVVRELLED